MNKALLTKVAKAIVAEADHFDMGDWLMIDKDSLAMVTSVPGKDETLSCNTTMCIAGWAVALTPNRYRKHQLGPDCAQDLLKITEYEGQILFYVDDWPDDLKKRYTNAESNRERAQVAADRIQWFIENEE